MSENKETNSLNPQDLLNDKINPQDLDKEQQFGLSVKLAELLKDELNNNSSPNMEAFSNSFKKFSPKATHYGIKNGLGIESLIKYNLDLDSHFGKILEDINEKYKNGELKDE